MNGNRTINPKLKASKTDIAAGAVLILGNYFLYKQMPYFRFNPILIIGMLLGMVMTLGLHKAVPVFLNSMWIVRPLWTFWVMKRTGGFQAEWFLRGYLWLIVIGMGCILASVMIIRRQDGLDKVFFVPPLLALTGTMLGSWKIFMLGMEGIKASLPAVMPYILLSISLLIYCSRFRNAEEPGVRKKTGGQDLWDM